MNSILSAVLSLSISGSVLALLLMFLHPLMKNRTSKAVQYYVWLLVLLRLVIPFTIENSLVNRMFHPPEAPIVTGRPVIENLTGTNYIPSAGSITGIKDKDSESVTSASKTSGSPKEVPDVSSKGFSWNLLLSYIQKYQTFIWLFGALISILWFLSSYLRFYLNVIRSSTPPHRQDELLFKKIAGTARVRLHCNRYIKTPMLIGVFSPRILIPASAFVANGMERELEHILLHELTHCRRKDLWYKWFAVVVTSLHWFNPFMILLRKKLNRACELSCDEAVIAKLQPQERIEYGETLLSIAGSNRFPAGIIATTMGEGKQELKERLASIMTFKNKTIGTVLLSFILVISLTGCAVVLGVAAKEDNKGNVTDKIIATGSDVGRDTQEKLNVSDSSLPSDILDFDGDGLADSVSVLSKDTIHSSEDTKYAVMTVRLGNGTTIEKKIEGWWTDARCLTADFDNDTHPDIALIMGAGGSNYSATHVSVYRITDNELVEYSSNILHNDKSVYEQRRYTTFQLDESECIGANVINSSGKALLRVRMLLGYNPAKDTIMAYYLDLSWNGAGWFIEDMNVGAAYGEDKLIELASPEINIPDGTLIPSIHREGFIEAKLTVVGDMDVDIDSTGFDIERNMKTLSLREMTQIALRHLYDMTGILIKSCNIDTRYGVCLTMTHDGDHESFFSASLDNCTGSINQMHIAWKQAGVEYSPIDPSNCVKPDNAASMSISELVRWYYENSSYGDRRKVVRTEEVLTPRNTVSHVILYLENEDFYEVHIQENAGMPGSFYGPYEAGYTY